MKITRKEAILILDLLDKEDSVIESVILIAKILNTFPDIQHSINKKLSRNGQSTQASTTFSDNSVP